MMTRKSVFRRISQFVLLTILGPASLAFGESQYVSDELTVPLRSGASMQHRIISFLPSGTRLELLEASDDATFQHVKLDDKDGWVRVDQLMKTPSARAQLVSLNQRVDSLKAELRQGAGTIADFNKRIKQLEDDKRELEKNRDALATSLEGLKQVAARPAAIAEQNKMLQEKLASIEAQLAVVEADNAQLHEDDLKEWFMIGGGVSLLSLFLGLIIPSIKWRRRDSWGGGF